MVPLWLILLILYLVEGKTLKAASPKSFKVNRIHEESVFNKIRRYADWEYSQLSE